MKIRFYFTDVSATLALPSTWQHIPNQKQVFVRGGLLLFCGDGPGRSKCLGNKSPNSFSTFPCPYCKVEQVNDETGGDLGNPLFNIDEHKRTWGQIVDGFSELEALADHPRSQTERSKELGLVPPDASLPLPLYNAMRIVPTEHVPVERLHFDALVSGVHRVYRSSGAHALITWRPNRNF